VYGCTARLALGARGFAALNVVFVLAWLAVAVALVRKNRALVAAQQAAQVVA